MNELLADQVRVKKQLAEAEEQWMEAAEALESAEQALLGAVPQAAMMVPVVPGSPSSRPEGPFLQSSV